MPTKVSFWAFLILLNFNNSYAKFPDYIKLCKQDNNLSNCLIENVKEVLKFLTENDGDRTYNIPNVNKVIFPQLEFNLGDDLILVLTNNTYIGWGNFVPSQMRFQNNALLITGHMEEFAVDGPYSGKGKLMGIPFHGEGNWTASLKNFDMVLATKLQTQKTNGKSFFYLDSSADYTKLNITSVGRLSMSFSNLLGNDPQLTNELNAFINEYWKDLFDAAHPGVEKIIATVLAAHWINPYLKTTAIDDFFE